MADASGDGMSWSDWTQSVLGGVIDKYSAAKWVQPYTTEQMRLQALGENGYYQEGQRQPVAQTSMMNSTTMLLIGGALLAVVLLTRGR
jgi:hypothetical protein